MLNLSLNLINCYVSTRKTTELICSKLLIEDYVIQSMADVSPPRWHLAHTSWFFESFVLRQFYSGYVLFNPSFNYLFNSYYHGLGTPYPRARRGILSRPSVEEIYNYRAYVDKHIIALLLASLQHQEKIFALVDLGINHEQQHQELLLMDIKHNFYVNPESYAYISINPLSPPSTKIIEHNEFTYTEGKIAHVGHDGEGFFYDNERPKHQKFIRSFLMANRLVTNGEYCEFIENKGYEEPQWWLADGWDFVQKLPQPGPLYWKKIKKKWYVYTLLGLKELSLYEPVSHVSFFEAYAYANYRNLRLPTEEEWENFVVSNNIKTDHGNFLENSNYHPLCDLTTNNPQQFFGDVWEWTASPYMAYPGFKAEAGALGEYNGKFMNNQMVLRGGSCLTPRSHMRASYRNFFQPNKRWQCSGIRLAKDT